MKINDLKGLLPYLGAIVLFILVSLAYFSPMLEGKVLSQSDIMSHKGMSKEIQDHREKYGEEPLWTNSMFSGMPAYLISTRYPANKVAFVDKVLMLGMPVQAAYLFLSLLGFYFLLLTLGVNRWLSIAGALAFAFTSYFFIIAEAGHNSKAHAIAYMAPVLAGILVTLRGRLLAGGIITALALALQLKAGHPQITYYLLILVAVIGIAELIGAIGEKRIPGFLKAAGVLVLAAGLAFGTNITSTLTTLEYGKYSIRGKTELSTEKENRTSGLDKDYALDWSYGIDETMTLMVPNFKGGSSTETLDSDSHLYRFMQSRNQVRPGQKDIRAGLYWGGQPFTSGPVYVGIIVVFLFVLGLILVPGRIKWALLIATLLSVMLAWGKYFTPLSDLFLHYVPGYNKFRAVSMTLVIAQLTIPLLGFLGIRELMRKELEIRRKLRALYISGGVVGGILLITLLFSGGMAYEGVGDETFRSQIIQQVQQSGGQEALAIEFADGYLDALHQDRKSALRSDVWRSLLFLALGFGLLWLYVKKNLQLAWLAAILPVLILIDMWGVSRRYLNEDSYVNKRRYNQVFQQTEADKVILADKDPYFRVLNLTTNTFNEAFTSYWHKSIGGYHGAKLRRYQELIETHIGSMNFDVLNMLNTKYIINRGQDGRPTVIPNMQHMGNAWFVDQYRIVENADSELAALGDFDPAREAIVDKRFAAELDGYQNGIDSLGGIQLTDYRANRLTYRYNTGRDQLTVFSDVYYPKGWNAYVDGKLLPHFRVNFILRGMVLPAGSGELVFKFEPKTYRAGETISLLASVLLILIVLGGLGLGARQWLKGGE